MINELNQVLRMRRLKRYVPIFMIALMVQILAPIGAGWAFAAAISDPLAAAEICHQSDPSSQGSGQSDQTHDLSCVLCCGFIASAANFSSPEPIAWITPYRSASNVIWRENAPRLAVSSAAAKPKARAPPSIS
jgi:hypothetical protein